MEADTTPTLLGGVGRIVQIDESVMVKAEYYRAHQVTATVRWVFVVYDPTNKVGHIQLVDQRDAATLMTIIQRVVRPGSEIWLNRWVAYGQLGTMAFVPKTVDHSLLFKNPMTSVCTNHVEDYWSSVKRRFKATVGTSGEMVSSHLDQHTWREIYGQTLQLALLNLQLQL